ncbi:phosphomannomutase [Lentisphaera profundi]|uniref:Phosphomannomutase n=1 Tax=Lentisphaera profundi TaxID=1658616 RepID=A0ABY7VZ08_9BACT|nr:phosphomannomutase [Lentisphaera profundi]WDE99019.1 phosphomannomutase [Lentisphaera profundi]
MPKILYIEELMEVSGVKFGTSGARGLALAMSDEVCYAYTKAFLTHLETSKGIKAGGEVAIAGDLRPSSPRICAAVAKAAEDMGYKALYCGEIPSPAVAYYGFCNEVPSVMVTGSHIPDDRNGIKYNTAFGEILKQDEEGIRSQKVEIPEGVFDEQGFFVEPHELGAVYKAAEDEYIKRYSDFFSSDTLAGLRLGVYEHSCVGRDTMKNIYEKLGAKVIGLGRSEKFIPVDTEAIRPEDVKLASNWARESEFDALLSADGDCDRPLIADEKGQWLRGDVAGILCARFLKADAVATPVSCNSALELSEEFKSVKRTRIGSPYVIAAMKEASESGSKMVVAYEANGGFLTNSDFVLGDKTLSALPTRDAVILHIALLVEMKNRGCRLSDLLTTLPERYTISDRLKEFPTQMSNKKLSEFSAQTPVQNNLNIELIFGELCGQVKSVDTTDGVRVNFANKEVIHLRPSGNAPELRCYNEAGSEKRAIELNQACMEIMTAWQE